MKIAIIGGHLTPALAVIDSLSKKDEVVFFGRKYALEGDRALSLEYQTIQERKIRFEELKTGRLQRSFTIHTIPSLFKVPFGFYNSLKLLKKYKPDMVVGFGGYLSVPVIITARLLKIPTVIHEQTLEAGSANKFLSKYVDKICISFESSRNYFPNEKIVLTGNPIRKSIKSPKKQIKIKSKNPIIYITGGSSGSHFINELIVGCLPQLLDKYTLVHQTGDAKEFNDFGKLTILKEGLNNDKRDKYNLTKFYSPEEVGSILKQASLVISRAGVNSVSELLKLEKPALLIPLPVSQNDEQLKNALFLKDAGLGEIADQHTINSEEFLFLVNTMMKNIENYKLKTETDYFKDDAAKKIAKVIYEVQKNSN